MLRHAGLPVTTERVTAFLTAVDALGIGREQVYRAGLHTLCADPDDLPRYERAFVDWFDADPRRPPTAPQRPRTPRLSSLLPSGKTDGDRRATTTVRRCGRAPRAPRCCATTTSASCR